MRWTLVRRHQRSPKQEEKRHADGGRIGKANRLLQQFVMYICCIICKKHRHHEDT